MEITIKTTTASYIETLSVIEQFMKNDKNCFFPKTVSDELTLKTCYKCLNPINDEYRYVKVFLENENSTASVYVHHYHYN